MAYRETVLRFLSLQYGTTDGWAGLGIKTSSGEFSETWFPWPSEAEQMATAAVQEDSCGSDVWFCASVMREPKRAIGSSVARPRLHADIDRELTDEDAAKIEQLGAWVVYSGTPGHVHVYVELDEVVDVATYHSLENSLCAWLGADAKKRDNDLLRIPGLSNHKQQHPRAVMWDGSTGLRRWDAMELGALLPSVAYDAVENSSAAITAEPVESIPEQIGALLNTQAGSDRSTQAAKIINACAAAQFTEGETLYTLVQDPVQRERFMEKPATVFGEIRKMRATYIDYPTQEIQGFKELLGIPQDQPLPIRGAPPTQKTTITIEPEPPPIDSSSWARKDFEPLINGDYEIVVPTILERGGPEPLCLIYPGKTHSFHGEYESGKSLVLQYATVTEIEKGNDVLYLDFEDDQRSVYQRMKQLGASDDSIRDHLWYIRPEGELDVNSPEWQAITDHAFSLAVIDGVTEAMSYQGLDPNIGTEVARWQALIPNTLARKTGAGVCSIDHVTKSADSRGRSAIGSQHKTSGLSGAAYVVEPLHNEPPRKGSRSVVVLRVAKDRPGEIRGKAGAVRRTDRTQQAAWVVVDSTEDPEKIEMSVEMYQDPPSESKLEETRYGMAVGLINNRPGLNKTEAREILQGPLRDGCGGLGGNRNMYSEMWKTLEDEGFIEVRREGKEQKLYPLRQFSPKVVSDELGEW